MEPEFLAIACRFILKGKLVHVLVSSQLLMISSHSGRVKHHYELASKHCIRVKLTKRIQRDRE